MTGTDNSAANAAPAAKPKDSDADGWKQTLLFIGIGIVGGLLFGFFFGKPLAVIIIVLAGLGFSMFQRYRTR